MSKRIEEEGGEAFFWRVIAGIIFIVCITVYFAVPHASVIFLVLGIVVPPYVLAEASGAVDEHQDRRQKGYIIRALKDAGSPLSALEIASLAHHSVRDVRTDLSFLAQSKQVLPVAGAREDRQLYALAH